MDSLELRRDLRTTLREVCEAMRCQKEAVDRASSEFKHCSRETKRTLAKSYQTLDRLNRGDDGQRY